MRKAVIFLFSLMMIFDVFSQTKITGRIVDDSTEEPLIGATIIYGKGKGVATDFEGKYIFEIPPGERSFKVSYVGYKEINKILQIEGTQQEINFRLKTILLNEIQVVADIARDRETPVAFSNLEIEGNIVLEYWNINHDK